MVEFALVFFFFMLAFLCCLQLALIVVHKWEFDNVALQAARLYSIKWENESKGYSPQEALNQTLLAHYVARRDRLAAFMGFATSASVGSSGAGGPDELRYETYIPLMIPGAAQLMTDQNTIGGLTDLSNLGFNVDWGAVTSGDLGQLAGLAGMIQTLLNRLAGIDPVALILNELTTSRFVPANVSVRMRREPDLEPDRNGCGRSGQPICYDNDSL